MGPVEKNMTEKLQKAFAPTHLRIVNESPKHAGHTGDNGTGESHFRVEMTSSLFAGKNRLECQRMVHDVLKEELVEQIHALSLKLSAEAGN